MPSFLDALSCCNRGRPPVWLMRQAGRSLPEYRKLREHHTIEEQFRTPDLIAHITKMPIELLDVDAAILYTDILIVLDMLGIKWHIEPGRGPVVEKISLDHPLTFNDAREALPFLFEGMDQLRSLPVPLIGFCGAPYTLATYLLDDAKTALHRDPSAFSAFCVRLSHALDNLLKAQIKHGAKAVQIFDSWAAQLSNDIYAHLLPSIAPLANQSVPVILFGKGAHIPDQLATLSPQGLGLDWTCSLQAMRSRHPTRALQGNLDPHALLAGPSAIDREVERIENAMRGDPGFIFNLGHGVLPATPKEHVQYLVERIKRWN